MTKQKETPLNLSTHRNSTLTDRTLYSLINSYHETEVEVLNNTSSIVHLSLDKVDKNSYNGTLEVVTDVDFANETVTKKTISYTNGQITDIS